MFQAKQTPGSLIVQRRRSIKEIVENERSLHVVIELCCGFVEFYVDKGRQKDKKKKSRKHQVMKSRFAEIHLNQFDTYLYMKCM